MMLVDWLHVFLFICVCLLKNRPPLYCGGAPLDKPSETHRIATSDTLSLSAVLTLSICARCCINSGVPSARRTTTRFPLLFRRPF